jgi:hypothetical protein
MILECTPKLRHARKGDTVFARSQRVSSSSAFVFDGIQMRSYSADRVWRKALDGCPRIGHSLQTFIRVARSGRAQTHEMPGLAELHPLREPAHRITLECVSKAAFAKSDSTARVEMNPHHGRNYFNLELRGVSPMLFRHAGRCKLGRVAGSSPARTSRQEHWSRQIGWVRKCMISKS